MIAVTFALPAESSDFTSKLTQIGPHFRDGGAHVRGEVNGRSVAVFHTGVGRISCCARIQQILGDESFDYLISAGFAGALAEELEVGDILVATNFSDPDLQKLFPETDGVVHGTLTTAARVIDSFAERERLRKESGALGVDMETEFIAKACAAHRVKMLSLRAVSDTPVRPLPAPANVLFDIAKQKTDFARLAYYLATRPQKITKLIGFHRQIVLARQSLTKAITDVIGQM